MEAKTETGLTLEDIATLADGTGNIPDETAESLKPLIREDARFAEALAALRQMADDAGTKLAADGLDAFRSLTGSGSELGRSPPTCSTPTWTSPSTN